MSNLDLLWLVPVMLLLLLLKGFFSGSEIALVNADKIKLGHAARQGHSGARLVVELFRRPERLLATTLVGTNVATVTLTTMGTLLMIHFFGNEMGDLYAFAIYTPLFLVLGEVVPKAVYQQKADALAPIVVYPLRFFGWIFAPIVFVFSAVARFVARRVGGGAAPDRMFVARDQLRALMEMGAGGSDTQVFDRYRIERAIRFPDTTVGEHMVPAGEVVALPRDVAMDEAVATVRRTGHTVLPIYEGNVSNVVGTVVLTPWDLLDRELGSRSPAERMQAPAYVSPQQTLEELAALLRDRRDRMAVVVDEYGTAMGLITMEDVLEAVVGEIEMGYAFDESREREARGYEEVEGGAYRMDGRLSISEANDVLGLDLSSSEFHTVGGLVTARLRRLARPGDSVVVEGYRFTVEAATERVVQWVRVEPEVAAAPGRT